MTTVFLDAVFKPFFKSPMTFFFDAVLSTTHSKDVTFPWVTL